MSSPTPLERATAPAGTTVAPSQTLDLSTLAPRPTAERAELVLRFQACDLGCEIDPGTIVLADGRVMRWSESGMVVRQLTPSGMQRMLDLVAASGLLEEDSSYEPKLRAGMESGGFGPTSYRFQVAGDPTVRVHSVDPTLFDADNTRRPGTWTIPSEVYALEDVAAKLKDPDAWLPPAAWAGPGEILTPEHYLLVVTIERGEELPSGTDADAVYWPFPAPIDAIGDPLVDAAAPNASPTRCLVVTRAEALAMAAAEGVDEDGYPYRSLANPFDSLRYPSARRRATVDVTTRMVLPYQAPTCAGAREW